MQSISNYIFLKGDRFRLKRTRHQTSVTYRTSSYRRIIRHTITSNISANVDESIELNFIHM